MTFSIRTFLIVIGILACWLGALVSNSPLVVELVANATSLLILLTLSLAIWDTQPEQRAFWTGFFVLAFGNLVFTHYFNAWQQTGHELARVILGEPKPATVQPFNPPSVPSWTSPPTLPPSNLPPASTPPTLEERFYQPSYSTVPYSTGAYIYQDNYYQRHAAIRTAVPSLLSLIAGVIGGWVTMWAYRRAKSAESSRLTESRGTTALTGSNDL